ncbi:cobyrinic acid a,c-diamide synthase [Aquimarina sp. MAR_2010_214]|uniref:cobyrinate a,c-diamide synthase n=1 Tax=Aquimarina sp. MAR_2010_214 TaxID=1250026 RepID=UPI000C71547D|nr:cobyrinate a,c-diamide synthase [Aquimarina sp. MAR_2010_214]PKV53137.1 cobyrinic acid a,c-diamide synthase [Aquimarina sp. MAR_2010_214]
MSKAFLIAAPWSNSGKTTLTLGMSRWFSNQGNTVQTFKCGPDYIDTIHHSTAARKSAVNLDTVMMPKEHVNTVFEHYSASADISIVEGVMGLFDGAVKDQGSSAAIAKLLDIPVILVVNASAMAYTIAPILHGLKTFDPEVKIAGVIFNFIKTESHYAFLKEACDTVGIPSLGYIPPNEEIAIPSRHLGLHIDGAFENVIEKAASHIATHISLPTLLKYAKVVPKIDHEASASITSEKKYKIAVAKDEAFTFTYLQNLKWLEAIGEIIYFSPIHDQKLPEADMIYLAGGYPELYLEALSNNALMKDQLKEAANQGTKILAECGGMMYLGNTIIDEEGKEYDMVGIFPFHTSMQHKKLSLGYRKVVCNDLEIWGHEFHYSKVLNDNSIPTVGQVFSAREKEVSTKIYQHQNVYASYIHLYWAALEESVDLCI